MNPILLLDGNSLAWRSYHSFHSMHNSIGKPTGILFGFLKAIETSIIKYNPISSYCIFDRGKSRWRREYHPEYKQHREKSHQDHIAKQLQKRYLEEFNEYIDPSIEAIEVELSSIYNQIDFLPTILEDIGIRSISVQGVEADDLIGLISSILLKEGNSEIIIIGGDKDLHQLINPRVICYDPIRKSELNESVFFHKYKGLSTSQFTDFRALVGDKSDNIPGINGIGEVTAISLINDYGNLDNLFDEKNIPFLDSNHRTRKIIGQKELANKCKILSTILTLDNLKELSQVAQVLTLGEIEAIYNQLSRPIHANRMNAVATLEANELDSVSNRLGQFLNIVAPKEDPVQGFADFFKQGAIESISPPENSILNDSFETLDSEILACQKCALRMECSSPVTAQGFDDCKIMLIGRNPGAIENETGIPFTGRSGKRLDKFLSDCGINREDCYITNVCKCYSLSNRAPTHDEIKACIPYLRREIDLLNPKLILTFGTEAMRTITGCMESITKNNGKIYHNSVGEIGPVNSVIISMVHPSFVIRNPIENSKYFDDKIDIVKNVLEEIKQEEHHEIT